MAVADFPAVDAGLQRALTEVCGAAWVSIRPSDRLAYARDMWPRCLIRQRGGHLDHPPDLVVWPASVEQVARVVEIATAAQVPLLPFGAGSGVCGATLPHRGGIVCDLKRLERLRRLDIDSGIAEVEVGLVGEVLERQLNSRGLSCGHFPSSIVCSTVGGWVAARGAGQCSSRYGKIEDLVQSLEFVDHRGRICRTRPRAPAGDWSADPLLVGSEGTAGVITAVELAVQRLPEQRWMRGYRFPDVDSGLRAMRQLMRQGWRPAVLRLYDEFDTIIAGSGRGEEAEESLLRGLGKRLSGPARQLLRLGLPSLLARPRWLNRLTSLAPLGCLLVVVEEGPSQLVERAAAGIDAACRACRGVDLGPGPARHWWEHRYDVSYKQAPLFTAGAFVDTMEVATTWDRLPQLYQAVRRALQGLVFVMAHFSHAYREGCSIYFTFAGAAAGDDRAAARYDEAWQAAQDAVFRHGAVVSHHHGIGLLKQRFLQRQLAGSRRVLQVVKDCCDPAGIFNPGKLGLDTDSRPVADAGQAAASTVPQECLAELRQLLGRRLRQDTGELAWPRAPAALALPRSSDELGLVVKALAAQRVAWVSFGRGSRLAGFPAAGWPAAYLGVGLSGLAEITAIEPDSLWLAAEAGTPLEAIRRACRKHGLRPVADLDGDGTLGGWLAGPAAAVDAVIGLPASPVLGLEVITPDGRLQRTVPTPRAACGPDLTALWLGTGGTLGIITAAVLRLEPEPERTWRRSFAVDDRQAGLELAARLAREGPLPARRLAGSHPGGSSPWRLDVTFAGHRPLVEAAAAWCLAVAARAGARQMDAGEMPEPPAPPGAANPRERHWRWTDLAARLRQQPDAALSFRHGWHGGCLVAMEQPADERPGDGDCELELLAAIRRRLDPGGLCNPQAWPPGRNRAW